MNFDPRLEIARGRVPIHRVFRKMGRISTIDAGDPRTEVWDGGAPYVFPSSGGVVMTVSSSSTSDDVGGAGATQITVTGLDAGFRERTVVADLDGQNGVSIGTFARINDAFISGGASNVGNIRIGSGTVTLGVPANTFAFIKANYHRTLQAIYTVPSAHKVYITDVYCGILEGSTGKTADLGLCYHNDNGPAIPIDSMSLSSAATSYIHKPYAMPIEVLEEQDITIAVDDVSANGTAVTAGFSMIVVAQ